MKRLLSIIALLIVALVVTPNADARRFGGGRSFGKTFRTAPRHQSHNTFFKNKTNTKTKSAHSSRRRGFMGGLFGGLLAGGLLGSLFGGGYGGGFHFMNIIMIGIIAYVAFKFLRGLIGAKQAGMDQRQSPFSRQSSTEQQFTQQSSKQSARDQFDFDSSHNQQFESANSGYQSNQHGSASGFGAKPEVPHQYPPGFNITSFVDGAREHYRILQGAWNHNQLEMIQEYVSASLFEDLKQDRATLNGEQHTYVMYVDAEIVRADYNDEVAQLSLQFTGRYRDVHEGIEEDISDIWHLERDLTTPNAPWLIVGIQG